MRTRQLPIWRLKTVRNGVDFYRSDTVHGDENTEIRILGMFAMLVNLQSTERAATVLYWHKTKGWVIWGDGKSNAVARLSNCLELCG
jgi:hypothetical protein